MVNLRSNSNWDVNRLINEFLSESPVSRFSGGLKNDVPVNIYENPEHFLLEINAPGRNKERFTLKVEAETLLVQYEKCNEEAKSAQKSLRKDFTIGGFAIRFHIDERIEADKIGAHYEAGILNVVLPKKPPVTAAAKTIAVQ